MACRDVRADEVTTLADPLEVHRAAARAALAALTDDQARRRALPASELTAGGVLKHLARMEDLWFCRKMAGDVAGEPWAAHHAEEGWDVASAERDDVATLLRLYDNACDRSRRVQAQHRDLDEVAAATAWGGTEVSVRWIYVHLVEEIAQHVGHLDLLGDALLGEAPRRPSGVPTDSRSTRLVVLRGNSGAGKTTIASTVQHAMPRGTCAVVGQDVMQRTVLRADDDPGNASVDLIELTARLALDRGMNVVVEGMLVSSRYGEMLTRLARDHRGATTALYLDVGLEETLRRHATKVPRPTFGEAEMQSWYRSHDLVPGLDEVLLAESTTLDAAVDRVRGALAATPTG